MTVLLFLGSHSDPILSANVCVVHIDINIMFYVRGHVFDSF